MKRLVICCDGTWNRADQEHDGQPCPTNVVKLAFRVAKADGAVPQIIHYDQGVGTGNAIDRLTGGAFGDGLEDNIYTAYRFLTANYEPGDELYFFGYSRGAYTVRSVVGMVRKCGILSRAAVREYGNAIALYRNDQHPDQEGPSAFRKAHSITGDQPIPVKCIGVWDTVGALGIPAARAALADPLEAPVPRCRAERNRRACLPCAGHRRAPGAVRGDPVGLHAQAGTDRRTALVRWRPW